jgi:hypothetical protein
MRQIHPTSLQEKFVARGAYTLIDPHTDETAYEQWTISELHDNSQLIRVDKGEWGKDTLLVEVLQSSPEMRNRIERCEIHAYRKAQVVKTIWSFYGDHIQIGRTINGSEYQQHEVSLPGAAVVAAPGLINCRYILELVREGNASPVFHLPLFDDDRDNIGHCSVIKQNANVLNIMDKTYEAYPYIAICFLEETQQQSHKWFYFDEHNVLLKQSSLAGEAILTQYVRRPEQ